LILEVEEKVNEMVEKSTLNEYKSYKHLVKHKKRVNRVFSELGAKTALRSHPPGVEKKVLLLSWLVVRLLLLKLEGRGLQRKRRIKVGLVIPLLLPFARQKLSIGNSAK
jgi:hypothetical protein